MAIMKQGKYALAGTKWMDREATGFTKTFLKLPPGVQIYKLKTGKAKLDIIPYVAGKRNPDADEGMLYWKLVFWVHRNVGPNRDTVICPAKTLDKPCPVCEDFARQMRTNPSDEEYKQIQELRPKEWELMQIRDRNNKDVGIQLLPLSFHRLSDKIVEQAAMGDEEQHWGDFWHPKGGKALFVNWGEDSSGQRGGKYIRAKGVNFLERPDLPDSLIDKGHCLDELLLVYKYDKLKEMHGETHSEEEGEEEEGEESEENEETEEGEEEEAPKPKKKKKAPAAEEEEGEAEEGEEEEGEEEEEAPAPKKKKKKPAPEPEEEEGEEESSEEEGEEEEEAPAPKKKKKKPAAEEEEEEGEEESGEEEGEEEEEEAPAPKKKKKPAPEPEEEEGEEEEEEEAPAPKKKKKPAASEEPSDWDQFDKGEPEEAEAEEGEEEEEEAPKPKKKKKK